MKTISLTIMLLFPTLLFASVDLEHFFDDDMTAEERRCENIYFNSAQKIKMELDHIKINPDSGAGCLSDIKTYGNFGVCKYIAESLKYAEITQNEEGGRELSLVHCTNSDAFEAQYDYIFSHLNQYNLNRHDPIDFLRDIRTHNIERVVEYAVTDYFFLSAITAYSNNEAYREGYRLFEKEITKKMKHTKVLFPDRERLYLTLSHFPHTQLDDIIEIVKIQGEGLKFSSHIEDHPELMFNVLDFWNKFLNSDETVISSSIDGLGAIDIISLLQIEDLRGKDDFVLDNISTAFNVLEKLDFKRQGSSAFEYAPTRDDYFALSLIHLAIKRNIGLAPIYKKFKVDQSKPNAIFDLLQSFNPETSKYSESDIKEFLRPVRQWEEMGIEQCEWKYLHLKSELNKCPRTVTDYDSEGNLLLWVEDLCTPEQAYNMCISGKTSTPEQTLKALEKERTEKFTSSSFRSRVAIFSREYSKKKTYLLERYTSFIRVGKKKFPVIDPSLFFIATKGFTVIRFADVESSEEYPQLVNGTILLNQEKTKDGTSPHSTNN